ncbi:pyridoxal phosphate-dependent aminotransferase [Senegalimassilia anaerobia]|uniref:pyridoxal phosphate-dependent aminotransferase n=1 Tax=Senegalimassilia anaerobia TaxID=1473216 RepID=UPI003A96D9EF
MIDERMYGLGNAPSAIRELFAYGLKRKAEIGEDKVFDYSIGNPSVPAPQKVADTIEELMKLPPVELHAYSPAAGIPAVRQTIADSIARRYGIPAKAGRVYMTVGAAASIAISLGAVTNAGDEVIVPSPYFPEYKVWIETMGCSIVEVPTQVPSFQLDVEAMGAAINGKTAAVIINSPNNPVGAVYTRENLEALAAMLEEKGKEIGHPIYLISDEPYREITYGVEVPYVPTIYPRTLVCYSYSKALSLPGERVGYVYVSDTMDAEEADRVFFAVAGAGRAHGYICAPVLFQRVAAACVDEPSDVEAYATNRRILTEALDEMGYEYVQPDGAFYLWVRALEPDAQAFSDRAKQHELLIVPSDSFGCPGWVRMSYCIARETIENSLPALKALKESYDAE